MTWVSSWRTAVRVARREARRARGRSVLVVAMIGLPVLGLSFAAVSYDMFRLTGAEQANRTMGTADGRVSWDWRSAVEQSPDGTEVLPVIPAGPVAVPGRPAVQVPDRQPVTDAELLTRLPAATNVISLRHGSVELRTADGVGGLTAVAVDADSPLTYGLVEVLQGRAPRTPAEVALTGPAMTRLGTTTGGWVTSADGSRSYSVVGRVEFPSLLGQVALFAPVTDAPVTETAPAGFELNQEWLVDTQAPITWAEVRRLNQSGIVVAARHVFVHQPPADQVPIRSRAGTLGTRELAVRVIIFGLGLLEVVLLAGPAFAVSARRRQRQLALVAANGGTPAHVRRVVLADGLVLGLMGAAVGVGAGILTALIARPFIEEYLANARAGGYRVFPGALAAIAALAVLTGVLAALVPAAVAARQDVVSALAGRRAITRSRKRWLILGLVLVILGTATVVSATLAVSASLMLAGLIIGELGMVLCTPALVGLVARLGRLLPLAPRIALRAAARTRTAAAPAISAVMAAVAGSVAIGLYLDSNRAQNEASTTQWVPTGYATVWLGQDDPNVSPPSPAAVEAMLRSTLPVAEVATVSAVSCADAADGAAGTDHLCSLVLQLPPERVCPYLDELHRGVKLTARQRRAARADPRCDERAMLASETILVDDGTAVPMLTGASPTDVAAAAAVLRAGGVVVRDARFITGGRATFAVIDTTAGVGKGRTCGGAAVTAEGSVIPCPAVPGGALPDRDPVAHAPRMSFPAYLLRTGLPAGSPLISPAAVDQAGLGSTATMLVASTTRPPSQTEQDRFNRQLQAMNLAGRIESGPPDDTPLEVWIMMAAAAAITLGAAGIATGLAAADGRADLSTLAAVGASPRLRRGLSLSQSGVIAGLGSLLGAAAGLGASTAILAALNQRFAEVWPGPPEYPIAVPWLNLGVALLVVPALAMLGAGLLTRSRLPVERRV